MEKLLSLICVLHFVNLAVAIPIGTVLKQIGIDEPCQNHRECSVTKFAECSSGKCKCLPNRRWNYFDGCLGAINEICDFDHDCENKEEVGCIFNTCQNYSDFFTPLNAEKIKLYRATTIGSRCETDHHCSDVRNTACTSGKCSCIRGYWRDWLTGICRIVTNQTCGEKGNYGCKERGTRCFFNTCMLPTDFFDESNALNASLYVARGLRSPCGTDYHCRNIKNSHCNAGQCECIPNFSNSLQGCQQVLNASCNFNYECDIPGLECLSNTCLHPKDFFVKSNLEANSYAAKGVSYSCRTDHHCRNLNYTHCFEESCTCINGYHDVWGKCSPVGYSSCSNDGECYIYGDRCFLDVCYRPSDFFTLPIASLFATKKLGDICDTDHHCRNLNHSVCVENHCTCHDDYENNSGKCRKQTIRECRGNFDCTEPGFYCFLNICLKPNQFFLASNSQNSSLYAAQNVYDVCRTDHHCRNVINTHCSGNTCDCLPGYEVDGHKCQKAINVTCSHDSDCLMPRSYCFFNTCLYPEYFLAPVSGYNTSLYAAKHANGFCQTDHHCREVENSMCVHRKCTCQDQYTVKHHKCEFIN